MAKQTYEAGFMSFLGTKFSQEFVSSADGFVVNILNKPVRFGEDDVNQLVEIFKTFKQNN